MSDFFTPEQVEYLSATTVRCALMNKFDFVSETIYAWNGNFPKTIDGNTYQPMKRMASIDGLGMSADGAADAVTLSLNGLPAQTINFLSKALAETPEADQQLLTISMQLFDNEWQDVGTPIGLFWGFMQPPKITRSPMQDAEGGTQGVSISAENAFFNRSRPPHGRNTDRDQQARSPGDKFFGFVASIVNKLLKYPDY